MNVDLAIAHLLNIVRRPPRWSTIADEIARELAPTLTGRSYGPYTVERQRLDERRRAPVSPLLRRAPTGHPGRVRATQLAPRV